MRVLVSGGAGFIGHRIIEELLVRTSHDVVSLDRLDTSGNLTRLSEVLLERPGHCGRLTVVHHDLKAPINDLTSSFIGEVDYVLHLAAASHVDRSIDHPTEFVLDNVLGTVNLLEWARRESNLRLFLYFSCYDERTKALTTEGFKTFEELKPGDRVLSIDSKGRVEDKPVDEVIIQNYEGDMVYFGGGKHARVSLAVTPNHRMYYQCLRTGEILWEEAGLCARRTYKRYLPTGKTLYQDSDRVRVTGIGFVSSSDLFYLSGIFIGDGCVSIQRRETPSRSGLTQQQRRIASRDPKTGRYRSEGHVGVLESTTSTSWRVFLYIPETDACRTRVEETLDRLGVRWHGRAGRIYFASEYWCKFFEDFGKGAHNKRIPRWMLQEGSHNLRALFEGLIDSDGCWNPIPNLTTVSEELVWQACSLAAQIGLMPRFSTRETDTLIDGRRVSGKAFSVHFKNKASIGKHNARTDWYKGKIWCVKVRDNANLLVERDGIVSFCGNTDEVFGPAPEGVKYSEWDRYSSGNPYAASKAGAEEFCLAFENTYRMPIIVTHTMNVLGARQHPEKFLPLILRKLLRKEVVFIHSDPSCTQPGKRHYIDVADVADAVLFLMENYEDDWSGEKFNIVGYEEVDNLQLAKMVAEAAGENLAYKLVDFHSSRPGHDLRYALSGERMKLMGWTPAKPIKERVKEIVEWTLKNRRWLGK